MKQDTECGHHKSHRYQFNYLGMWCWRNFMPTFRRNVACSSAKVKRSLQHCFILEAFEVTTTLYLLKQPGSPIQNWRQHFGRYQWPRGTSRSVAARLLRLRARIPPEIWLAVGCALSSRGLCTDGSLIQRCPIRCVGVIKCDEMQH